MDIISTEAEAVTKEKNNPDSGFSDFEQITVRKFDACMNVREHPSGWTICGSFTKPDVRITQFPIILNH